MRSPLLDVLTPHIVRSDMQLRNAAQLADWARKFHGGYGAPRIALRPKPKVRRLLAGQDERSLMFLAYLAARKSAGTPSPLEMWREWWAGEKARQRAAREGGQAAPAPSRSGFLRVVK